MEDDQEIADRLRGAATAVVDAHNAHIQALQDAVAHARGVGLKVCIPDELMEPIGFSAETLKIVRHRSL